MEDRLRPNWFDRKAGALRIVDQTLLPGEVQYKELKTAEEVWTAIRILQVRGAPAIGVAAAYGAWLGAREKNPQSPQELEKALGETCAYLKTSRPTAVNLAWALSRMENAWLPAPMSGMYPPAWMLYCGKPIPFCRRTRNRTCALPAMVCPFCSRAWDF